MGAVMLVSEKNTATTVLRKIEVKIVDDEWTMNILDDPTAANPVQPSFEEANSRKLLLKNFYYQCKNSANFCTLKEYMKTVGKIISPNSFSKLSALEDKFKQSIKSEGLDPSIFNHAFVVQSRQYATHTSKTYYMAAADSKKVPEILGFMNEKYKLTQTGLIRDKIWLNKDAKTFEDNE